jgi:hypothetical protein
LPKGGSRTIDAVGGCDVPGILLTKTPKSGSATVTVIPELDFVFENQHTICTIGMSGSYVSPTNFDLSLSLSFRENYDTPSGWSNQIKICYQFDGSATKCGAASETAPNGRWDGWNAWGGIASWYAQKQFRYSYSLTIDRPVCWTTTGGSFVRLRPYLEIFGWTVDVVSGPIGEARGAWACTTSGCANLALRRDSYACYPSPSRSKTPSPTSSRSKTPSPTATRTNTPSTTRTNTPTPTISKTPSDTPTASVPPRSATASFAATVTETPERTALPNYAAAAQAEAAQKSKGVTTVAIAALVGVVVVAVIAVAVGCFIARRRRQNDNEDGWRSATQSQSLME